MERVDQPRPFDLDEERDTPMTLHEQCEANWLLVNGKTIETLTSDDLAALRVACPVYASPGEHSER